MVHPTSQKLLSEKDIKIICLSIGGFYAALGAFSLFMVKLQSMMFSTFGSSPDKLFDNALEVLHKIWVVYMPLLLLLGLGYLAFGFLFGKIKAYKYQINLFLSILCLIWGIAYAISCIEYFDAFFTLMANGFAAFKYSAYVFAGFGIIMVFALMTVPQYMIGRLIKKQEIEKLKSNY
jgi:hypothetical protein